MIAAVRTERPALCFFLGDGERDLKALQERYPALPVFAVRGNCDLRSGLSSSLVCTVGGVRVLAVHGHLHQVKYEPGLESLTAAAKEAGAQLALFGHTHRPTLETRQGITLLNPGAAGSGKHGTYAVLSLEDGRFQAELKSI